MSWHRPEGEMMTHERAIAIYTTGMMVLLAIATAIIAWASATGKG